MRPYVAIDNKDMPAPDAKVRYGQGMFGPAMFHYAPEGSELTAIAKEHGFELLAVRMADDLEHDHPLVDLYFEKGECEKVFAAWQPKSPGGGWKIAGCHDTEDGPIAIFLRKATTSAAVASHDRNTEAGA